MTFIKSLQNIKLGKTLDETESFELLNEIIGNEEISDSQIVLFLTELSKRQSSVSETLGFLKAMQKYMISINMPLHAIDTCGTGGDKSGSFNISTATAILVSSAGVAVAKHGNRAATSLCGSADVLEALHIPIDLHPTEAQASLKQNNFVFLFAPLYHPKLKRFSLIRKQLGFPTVFNMLGPLLNPAHVKYQVLGTYSEENCELLAKVIAQMKVDHAIILTGENGLDEANVAGLTTVYEVRGRTIDRYKLDAREYGLHISNNRELRGGDAKTNANIILTCFNSTTKFTAVQKSVVFNSAIALYISGKSNSITEGVTLAKQLIQNGNALTQLKKLRK